MANNQIEKYRIEFDKMPISQKKIFIERLRKQIQGKNLPTYNKFLSECVQKYNTQVRKNTNSLKDTDSDIGTMEIVKPKTIIIVCIIITLATFIIYNVMSDIGNNKLVGDWRSPNGTEAYIFESNGEYVYMVGIPGIDIINGQLVEGTPTVEKEYGRYTIEGNTITLIPNNKSNRSYTFNIHGNDLVMNGEGKSYTYIRQ